jgi:hypothetical protein
VRHLCHLVLHISACRVSHEGLGLCILRMQRLRDKQPRWVGPLRPVGFLCVSNALHGCFLCSIDLVAMQLNLAPTSDHFTVVIPPLQAMHGKPVEGRPLVVRVRSDPTPPPGAGFQRGPPPVHVRASWTASLCAPFCSLLDHGLVCSAAA